LVPKIVDDIIEFIFDNNNDSSNQINK
jgi:hypothetical protein